jgi:hypothetical protein
MISHHPAITHAIAHQHRAELHRQAERSRRSRHAARISPRRNPRGIHSINGAVDHVQGRRRTPPAMMSHIGRSCGTSRCTRTRTSVDRLPLVS